MALLDFLNAAVRGDGFEPALASRLRLNLHTRHLRAYTLLLQFGAGGLRDPARAELRARLRHFGALCCGRRLISEQAETKLIRSLRPEGAGWPLRLPPEPLAFYSRVLLERTRARAADGAPADDPLIVSVLEDDVASLRAGARRRPTLRRVRPTAPTPARRGARPRAPCCRCRTASSS